MYPSNNPFFSHSQFFKMNNHIPQPSMSLWGPGPHEQFLSVNAYTSDIGYPNGIAKFKSFNNDFFFEDGKKAFDGFSNKAYYKNGKTAFDSFHGHIFYHNGNKAYDGFFFKAKYANGKDLGKSGITYAADNVSMTLGENVDEFMISLGDGFSIWVAIGEKPRFKRFKFYDGSNCAIEKTL